MNWYKKTQLSEVDILEDHKESYYSIGHQEDTPEYNKNNPNYLWVFYDGDILSEEETTKKNDTLEYIFWTFWKNVYRKI